MKLWIKSFFMAWGMFLAVPCPLPVWDERARDRMLVCLPFIGGIIGGLWALAAFLLSLFPCPAALRALALTAVPFLLTGFIHLDGFMDVSDAVMSRRDIETRRKILKDPHCGSFAVISLALLLMAQWSLFFHWEYSARALLPLALIPFASRASAGMAVIALKPMETSQYNSEHDKKLLAPLAVLLAAACAVPAVLCGLCGLAPLAAALFYWAFALYGKKQLGGMNGDISGWALTIGELAGTAIIIIVRLIWN